MKRICEITAFAAVILAGVSPFLLAEYMRTSDFVSGVILILLGAAGILCELVSERIQRKKGENDCA